MIRILHILGTLDQGGAQTYILRYLDFDQGNTHYILCQSGIEGALADEYRKKGAIIISNIKFHYLVGNYLSFIRFLRKEKIDVVWNGNPDILLILSWLAGKKTILFHRGSQKPTPKNILDLRYLYLKVMTWTCRKIVNKVLANSYTALNNYHPNYKKDPLKYKVIYNGIRKEDISTKNKQEIRALLGIPENCFVIGHSGRLDFSKNHDMIINVAIKLCKKYDDIHFILMGLNVDKNYSPLINSHNLLNQIHLMGYRTDVMDILKGLDLFYFPSITEGNPNALLEAMVSNIPFVASDIPPIRESVPDYLQCTLINPYNEEENYSAIEDMYLHREELKIRKCKEWAIEHYDAYRQFNLFKEELEN